MTPRVVLVGLPGTGKSTTGRRLARILCVEFADSDDLVERASGRCVREIFAAEGEPAFRTAEADAIATALTSFDGVLALGGGALTTDRTRHALTISTVPVALLVAPIDTLAERVGDGTSRPLLVGDPVARLTELAAAREPTYRAVATLTVHTENRTPGQVAAHLAARLHDHDRVDHETERSPQR